MTYQLLRLAQAAARKPKDLVNVFPQIFGPSVPDLPDGAMVFNHKGGAEGLPEDMARIGVTLTDEMPLLAAPAMIDLLGVPAFMVPITAQLRADFDQAPLDWWANLDCQLVKFSTAGDAQVLGPDGKPIPVPGGTGNKRLRTQMGCFGAERTNGVITAWRVQVMKPYSRNEDLTAFDSESGVLSTTYQSDMKGVAYSVRAFLMHIAESGKRGVVAFKPTQCEEDQFATALVEYLVDQSSISFEGYKNSYLDKWRSDIKNLLGAILEEDGDFFSPLSGLDFALDTLIADNAFIEAMVNQTKLQESVYLLADEAGDLFTDMVVGIPQAQKALIALLSSKGFISRRTHGGVLDETLDIDEVMSLLQLPDGMDLISIMYTPNGVVPELTLGTAPLMFEELVANGDVEGYQVDAFVDVLAFGASKANPTHEAWIEQRAKLVKQAWAKAVSSGNAGFIAAYEAARAELYG